MPPEPSPKILILDARAPVYARALADHHPDLRIVAVRNADDARAEIADCEVLMAFGTALDQPLLAQASQLRWIQALSAGVDSVLRNPALRSDTALTSASGIHGPLLAEMAALGMLALARRLPRLMRQQQAGRWQRERGSLLAGKKAVVLGTGASGQAIRGICQAFGMQVLAASRTPRPLADGVPCVALSALAAHLADADFLLLATPSSPQTAGLVDARLLAALQPGAYLVNLARGDVLVEDDLVAALDRGHLAGAMLDVARQEPPPPEHPFWHHPDILLTPHVAGYVEEYEAAVLPLILDNLGHYRAGRYDQLRNLVRAGHLNIERSAA
jgi:D-2-hydroxyacid dehydrogenase (NADP+)